MPCVLLPKHKNKEKRKRSSHFPLEQSLDHSDTSNSVLQREAGLLLQGGGGNNEPTPAILG